MGGSGHKPTECPFMIRQPEDVIWMGLFPSECSNPCGGGKCPLVAEEHFMIRRLLAALCLTALAFVWTAQAEQPVRVDPAKVKTTGTAEKDFNAEKLALEQQQIKREFREFTQQLLRLAQDLELSNKPE